jgi:hypothetical protein
VAEGAERFTDRILGGGGGDFGVNLSKVTKGGF